MYDKSNDKESKYNKKIELFRKFGIEYLSELKLVTKTIELGIKDFENRGFNHISNITGKSNEKDSEHPAYNSSRLDEIAVSIVDDICRYATYHNINVKSGLVDVSQPTKAAYFTKWIVKFKPCNLDMYVPTDEYLKSTEEAKKFVDFSNEYLCDCIVSIVLGRPGNKNFITELLDERELKHWLYTLKYRTSHQDNYYSFYNRIYYN